MFSISIEVGAGQTGLQVAARFSQMNIKALVLDKIDRVGDNWRSRYSSLVLHTPRVHHTCSSPHLSTHIFCVLS